MAEGKKQAQTHHDNTEKRRKVTSGTYKSFTLQKRIKPVGPGLPSGGTLLRSSLRLLKKNWKPFAGIAAIYGFINIALIQTLNSGDVANAKDAFTGVFSGTLGELTAGAGSFIYLLGLSGNVASATGSYQLLLMIVSSLAMIWALRQAFADKKVRIRDAYYRGMYPLIPFMLVLVVIGLQIIPVVIGSSLFSTVMSNGLASHPAEVVAWAALFFLLMLLSLYMLASSIFGLYSVSLPDMTPMRALRSVREIVNLRRWTVILRLLYLPLVLLVVSAFIMIPLILFATSVAAWMFYLLMVVYFMVAHTYLYSLYRSLL